MGHGKSLGWILFDMYCSLSIVKQSFNRAGGAQLIVMSVASCDLKLRRFTNTWNMPVGKISINILQILLKFLDGLTLGHVVMVIFEIAQPHILIVPINVSDCIYAPRI